MKKNYAYMLKAVLAKVLVFAMVMMSAALIPATSVEAAANPKFTKTSLSVLEGESYTLKIANKVKGSTYSWKSSNKKIAKVSQKGVIEAISKGKATITSTVKVGKKTYRLTTRVTVIMPAKTVEINNKVTMLNLGQTYDFNRRMIPTSANDKITWTSDDENIAVPDKNGNLKTLRKGTVTITGTMFGGKSDFVTFKVIDEEGLVVNQEGLDKLVTSGIGLITIRTKEAEKFTIPAGDYSNTRLIVDAPNSDVYNNGNFKTIEIRNIKSDTWYEGAQGNRIEVTADKVRIVVSEKASAGIEIKQVGSKIVLVNDGIVTELEVGAAADIEISGASKKKIPVTTTVEDIKVTSSVPLMVKATEKISLILNKGSEGTTVRTPTQETAPAVSGSVIPKVTIAPLDDSEGDIDIDEPEAGPTPTPEPTYNGPSGPSDPLGPLVPTTQTVSGVTSGGVTTYTLPVNLESLISVEINFASTSSRVASSGLSSLKDFLNNESATVAKWTSITEVTKTSGRQQLRIEGTAGSTTKTVTFSIGLGTVRAYTINVDAGSRSVTFTNIATSASYTVTMGTDNRTLTISGAPAGLTFVVTY